MVTKNHGYPSYEPTIVVHDRSLQKGMFVVAPTFSFFMQGSLASGRDKVASGRDEVESGREKLTSDGSGRV